MKRLITVMVFPVLILGCGVFSSALGSGTAGQKDPAQEFFVTAVWNVQSLFDGQETGNEYREFLEPAGWTAEKYTARINAVSQAVLQMADMAPEELPLKKTAADLIGFVELENAGVLEDLARGELSKHGYFWTAFAAIPGSSLGIGFLSRFPLLDVRAHSITVDMETAPRPVLEVRVEPGRHQTSVNGQRFPSGKPLVFLLCHWKSKLGGEDATEAQRRASARVIQRRLRELREIEADTPVIVMGDLNENHDEYYRCTAGARESASVLYALLPDNPEAASLAALVNRSYAALDYLVLSAEKPPRAVYFPEAVQALYSPWEEEVSGGSYYYRGQWETIDHFLLSGSLFDSAGWNYAGFRVLNEAPFTGSDKSPNTYVPRTGMGLSDHLPLLLYLRDIGEP